MKHGSMLSRVQQKCIAVYLSSLQVHRMNVSVVVLDLDRPGLIVVVIFMSDVHDRGHDVRENLVVTFIPKIIK